MNDTLEAQVYECLEKVIDPCSAASVSPMNLVEMGLVRQVRVSDDGHRVDVDLRLTSPQCMMIAHMTKATRRLVSELNGVEHVEVHADLGLDWAPSDIRPEAQERRRRSLELRLLGQDPGHVGCH